MTQKKAQKLPCDVQQNQKYNQPLSEAPLRRKITQRVDKTLEAASEDQLTSKMGSDKSQTLQKQAHA